MPPVNSLFFGDIVGERATHYLIKRLPQIKAQYNADIVIVNAENAHRSGKGLTPSICHQLLDSGVDVITLGNHTLDQSSIRDSLHHEPRLIRPLNMTAPGYGISTFKSSHGIYCVANILGNAFIKGPHSSAIQAATQIKNTIIQLDQPCFSLVDIHAESTLEKQTIAYILDGTVTAIVGTHTHVPTADHRILSEGTAYISDVGMCGSYASCIGFDKKEIVNKALKIKSKKEPSFIVASGPVTLRGVMITSNSAGLATAIQPLYDHENKP